MMVVVVGVDNNEIVKKEGEDVSTLTTTVSQDEPFLEVGRSSMVRAGTRNVNLVFHMCKKNFQCIYSMKLKRARN